MKGLTKIGVSSTTEVLSPVNQSVLPVRELSSLEMSRTINLARILLIVGLVFLHYLKFPNSSIWPNAGLDLNEHSVATFVNSVVFFFFLSAVPLLSMVSGWLFFSFGNKDPMQTILARIPRRFNSLYLPLVFWNAVFMATLYCIYKTNMDYPLLAELNVNFSTAGWKDYINGIFALTRRPIAFQFWFVRDLFVTALVSPLFLLVSRRAPWLGALALGTAWICAWPMVIFLRPDVPFFFYLGTLVRQKQLPVAISLKAALTVFTVFIVLVCMRALVPLWVDSGGHIIPTWLRVSTALMRFVGVVACWGLLQHMAQSPRGIFIGTYSGLAFFLHSAHWPLIAFLKIWLWPLLPAETDFWMLVHDFACVSLTVTIGLGFGILLNRYAPAIFALMNGGRLLGETKG
jgi:succinoglycan biosynthesis protein ExoH